jgi:hypothetical protein
MIKIIISILIVLLCACQTEKGKAKHKCDKQYENIHIDAMIKHLFNPLSKIDLSSSDFVYILNHAPKNTFFYYGALLNLDEIKAKLPIDFVFDLRDLDNSSSKVIFTPKDPNTVEDLIYSKLVINDPKLVDKVQKMGKERIYYWRIQCPADEICSKIKRKLKKEEKNKICQQSVRSPILDVCQKICK